MTKRRMGKEDERQITGARQADFIQAKYQLYWILRTLLEDVDDELWGTVEQLLDQMHKAVPTSPRAATEARNRQRTLLEHHRERVDERIAYLKRLKQKYSQDKVDPNGGKYLDKEIAELEKRVVGVFLSVLLEKAEPQEKEAYQPEVDDVAADLLADLDLNLDWNGIE